MKISPPSLILRIFIMCYLLGPSVNAVAHENMIFNKPVDTPQSRYVIELMSRAYLQMGLELKLKEYSVKNALMAAANGEFDGQLGRIANISNKYPSLHKIPFALFSFDLLLISNKNTCKNCDINDLHSLSYRAGYPVANAYLDSIKYTGDRVPVKSIQTQLSLLIQNKVDAILVLDFQLKQDFPNFQSENFDIRVAEKKISYHFIHEKHQQMIPQLTQTLMDLEKDGIVQALRLKHSVDKP